MGKSIDSTCTLCDHFAIKDSPDGVRLACLSGDVKVLKHYLTPAQSLKTHDNTNPEGNPENQQAPRKNPVNRAEFVLLCFSH
jgi:hypothetical protein